MVDVAVQFRGTGDQPGAQRRTHFPDRGPDDLRDLGQHIHLAVPQSRTHGLPDLIRQLRVGPVHDHRQEGDVFLVETLAGQVDGVHGLGDGMLRRVDHAHHMAAQMVGQLGVEPEFQGGIVIG